MLRFGLLMSPLFVTFCCVSFFSLFIFIIPCEEERVALFGCLLCCFCPWCEILYFLSLGALSWRHLVSLIFY